MISMKISTERLCIRNAETTDALGVYELMSDEQTALQTGFSPMSHPSEAEGKIRKELVTGNLFVITKRKKHKRWLAYLSYILAHFKKRTETLQTIKSAISSTKKHEGMGIWQKP